MAVHEVPGWDEDVHQAVKDVVGLVGLRLNDLTTGHGQPPARQLAAAYLARVRRLVIAMDILYESGASDAIGRVLRICLETWVTGLWVLALGDEAVDMLLADYAKSSSQLIARAELDVDTVNPIEGVASLPGVRDRFKAAEAQLVAEGDANAGELVWTYGPTEFYAFTPFEGALSRRAQIP